MGEILVTVIGATTTDGIRFSSSREEHVRSAHQTSFHNRYTQQKQT